MNDTMGYKEKLKLILIANVEVQKKHIEDFIARFPNRKPLSRRRRRVPLDHPNTYRYLMMSLGFPDEKIDEFDFKDETYPERMIDDFLEQYGLGHPMDEILRTIIYDTEED